MNWEVNIGGVYNAPVIDLDTDAPGGDDHSDIYIYNVTVWIVCGLGGHTDRKCIGGVPVRSKHVFVIKILLDRLKFQIGTVVRVRRKC